MCFTAACMINFGWRGFSHFVRICPETLQEGTEPISSLASRLAVSRRLASPASAFPPGSPHVLSLCLLFRRSSNTSVPDLQRNKYIISFCLPSEAIRGHSNAGGLHPHPQYHVTAAPRYCYCACCSSKAATRLCRVCKCSKCMLDFCPLQGSHSNPSHHKKLAQDAKVCLLAAARCCQCACCVTEAATHLCQICTAETCMLGFCLSLSTGIGLSDCKI